MKRKGEEPKPKPMGPPCTECGELLPLNWKGAVCEACMHTALQRHWLAERGATETALLHQRLRLKKPAPPLREEDDDEAA